MKATIALTTLAALIAVSSVTLGAAAQTQNTEPAKTTAPATAPATPAVAAPPPATPAAAEAAAPEKAAVIAKPHLSRCALAIRATERKLEKSTATPDNVASAWHHIEEAKKTKGTACEAHAREASDLL